MVREGLRFLPMIIQDRVGFGALAFKVLFRLLPFPLVFRFAFVSLSFRQAENCSQKAKKRRIRIPTFASSANMQGCFGFASSFEGEPSVFFTPLAHS